MKVFQRKQAKRKNRVVRQTLCLFLFSLGLLIATDGVRKALPNNNTPAEQQPAAASRPHHFTNTTFVGDDESLNLTIAIITYNRPSALTRLLHSLNSAYYFGHKVAISLSVEAGAPQEIYDVINDFPWPHGTKTVRARVSPSGLIPAVVESWFPASDNEYGLLLEDDIEVSPFYYVWLLKSMEFILKDSKLQDRVFGISLYTPRVIETTNPYRHFRPDIQIPSYNTYFHQIPCSWGAMQFPKPWKEFHKYMNHRLAHNGSFLIVPGSRTNGWRNSWKKFYIELAWAKGMFMLYPNFPNQTSLSTNHLEAGVHILKNDDTHSPDNYTVPLQTSPLPVFDQGSSPLLDVFNSAYNVRPDRALLPSPVACAASNTGFTGAVIGLQASKGAGNKMSSDSQLYDTYHLVSTPQHTGRFAGFNFVASIDKGDFHVVLHTPSGQAVRKIFSTGISSAVPPKQSLFDLSLHFKNASLQLAPSQCITSRSHADLEVICKPTWEVALNSTKFQFTLQLRADGNLVAYEGCGCSNTVVWESGTSVPGFFYTPIVCQGTSDHKLLLPGNKLRSTSLKTLISDTDKHGRYCEAVMQTDGNFVLYRNFPDGHFAPASNIATNQKGNFSYAIDLKSTGTLRLLGFPGKKTSINDAIVLWSNGFIGRKYAPYFMKIDPGGGINVYEGYSGCDVGRRVWASIPSQHYPANCILPMVEQSHLMCGQVSTDVYNFFSDPSKLTVMVSTTSNQERALLVRSVINYLSNHPAVHTILVIWHNPYEPCPKPSFVNGKLVMFLATTTDSLNNRFYPSLHITTEAVLVLDDDIVVHYDDISLLLKTWQIQKDKIIGFFPRWTGTDKHGADKYLFQSEDNVLGGYSIMLTKAMVLHKKYLYLYNCVFSHILHDTVNENTNCEDLAMNFLVANATKGPSSLYVKPLHLVGDYGKSMPGSLQKRSSHQDVRTKCLQHFEAIFKLKLPHQTKSAYGVITALGMQVRLNSSYAGVDKHHIDCAIGQQLEGCFV